MCVQFLLILALNFSACQNGTESDSIKVKEFTAAKTALGDSVRLYQYKIDSLERLKQKVDSIQSDKSTKPDDKRSAHNQILRIQNQQSGLSERIKQFKKMAEKASKEQAAAIQKDDTTSKKDTVKAEPPKKPAQPETPFAPKYLKSEAGAIEILLEENNLAYLVYVVDLEKYEVHINWADSSKHKKTFNNFGSLRNTVYKSQIDKVKMMMNGGIFKVARDAHSHNEPLGLYVENGKEICPLNTTYPNSDNFYLKPNGVFYWNEKTAGIATTQEFIEKSEKLKFSNAVQSGPMLLINGAYHPAFKKGSQNLNIRNGVGVTADGKRLIFAISEDPTNFYDFALLFKHFGCVDALYLDGAISRVYMPEKGRKDLNGSFASIITLIQK